MSTTPKRLPSHPEAAKIVEALKMDRHPAEFGWYKEIHKSQTQVSRLSDDATRSAMTSIYFLQETNSKPLWRDLKSDEAFIWVKGAPLEVHMLDPKTGLAKIKIIGDVLDTGTKGDREIAVDGSLFTVPAGVYFNTDIVEPNSYSLFICLVAPGFEFEDFRLVPQSELHDLFPNHKPHIDRFF